MKTPWVRSHEELSLKDLSEIREVYRRLYLEKHTSFAPDYTLDFFQGAHESKTLIFTALENEGKIVGFFAYTHMNKIMSVSLLGYCLEKPHIYRILTTLSLDAADQLDCVLAYGSGSSKTKIFRGMYPQFEYVAIESSHLRGIRKYLWPLLGVVANIAVSCLHWKVFFKKNFKSL